MKLLTILTALAIGISAPAFAGKGQAQGEKKGGKRALALKAIDKDKNHKIEGTEVDALKTAFAKAPADGKARQRLDKNGNGKLDDSEIAALNNRLAKHAEKAGKPAKKARGKKKGKAA